MEDHKNARFEEADLSGAQFIEANLGGAQFRGVNFSNVRIRDAWLFNVQISGLVANLTVNGIDVSAYVETELNNRHPERLLLAPFDPDGMRTAWTSIEGFTAVTLDRARALPPEKLDESVDEEWSYLETLRHLVFAVDRWITGPVLDEASPFHPLGMPNPPHNEIDTRHFALDAKPTFDEVWAVRRDRMDRVAALVKAVDSDELQRQVQSPNGGSTTVMSCLHVVFREEWWHAQYANRDLSRSSNVASPVAMITVLLIIGLVLADAFVALVAGLLGRARGWPFWMWAALGLFFPVIAIIVVLVLPRRR